MLLDVAVYTQQSGKTYIDDTLNKVYPVAAYIGDICRQVDKCDQRKYSCHSIIGILYPQPQRTAQPCRYQQTADIKASADYHIQYALGNKVNTYAYADLSSIFVIRGHQLLLLGYKAADIQLFTVCPEAFQLIEVSRVLIENVDNYIAVVKHYPCISGICLTAERLDALL